MCGELQWAHNNSQWRLYSHRAEKADLPEMRDNDTITRKVHADGNKLCPGKKWRLYIIIIILSRNKIYRQCLLQSCII